MRAVLQEDMDALLKETNGLKGQLSMAQRRLESEASSSSATIHGLEQQVAMLRQELQVGLGRSALKDTSCQNLPEISSQKAHSTKHQATYCTEIGHEQKGLRHDT